MNSNELLKELKSREDLVNELLASDVNILKKVLAGVKEQTKLKNLPEYFYYKDYVQHCVPVPDTKFWYIDSRGGIEESTFMHSTDSSGTSIPFKKFWDARVFMQGAVFLTKEEAEKECKRRCIYTALKCYAERCNDPMSWDSGAAAKWNIEYIIRLDRIRVYYTDTTKTINNIYFSSEEIAKNAIKEIGEENIKLLFI